MPLALLLPAPLPRPVSHRRKWVCCSTPGMPKVLPWEPVEMASWSYSTKKRRPSSAGPRSEQYYGRLLRWPPLTGSGYVRSEYGRLLQTASWSVGSNETRQLGSSSCSWPAAAHPISQRSAPHPSCTPQACPPSAPPCTSPHNRSSVSRWGSGWVSPCGCRQLSLCQPWDACCPYLGLLQRMLDVNDWHRHGAGLDGAHARRGCRYGKGSRQGMCAAAWAGESCWG